MICVRAKQIKRLDSIFFSPFTLSWKQQDLNGVPAATATIAAGKTAEQSRAKDGERGSNMVFVAERAVRTFVLAMRCVIPHAPPLPTQRKDTMSQADAGVGGRCDGFRSVVVAESKSGWITLRFEDSGQTYPALSSQLRIHSGDGYRGADAGITGDSVSGGGGGRRVGRSAAAKPPPYAHISRSIAQCEAYGDVSFERKRVRPCKTRQCRH